MHLDSSAFRTETLKRLENVQWILIADADVQGAPKSKPPSKNWISLEIYNAYRGRFGRRPSGHILAYANSVAIFGCVQKFFYNYLNLNVHFSK